MDIPIQDLFDDLQDSSVDLTPNKAASAERIQALTLKKIRAQGRKPGKRIRFPILAAAVLLAAVLATTVLASSDFHVGDWFRDIFGQMTPRQQEAAQSLEMEQESLFTVNSNGTTVTLLSAIGDARNCYAKLRFQAPEGVDLTNRDPGLQYSFLPVPEKEGSLPPRILSCPELVSSRDLTYQEEFTFTDILPGDNLLDVTLMITLPQDSRLDFTDEFPDYLTLPALTLRDGDWNFTPLLEGPWEIPLTAMGGSTEQLPVQGRTCTFTAGEETYTLTLKKLTLSPMGIQLEADYDRPLCGDACFVYPTAFPVTLEGRYITGSLSDTADMLNRLEDGHCSYTLRFDAPVDPGDIDHIRIGDAVIPVSGEGTVVPAGEQPPQLMTGTHVVLGDPDSLRTGEIIPDPGLITGELDFETRLLYAGYAKVLPQGIRTIQPQPYGGRLILTLEDARVVTDLEALGGTTAGFEPQCFSQWDPAAGEWKAGDRPQGINADGSFQEGYQLVLLDLSVTNDGASLTEEQRSPSNPSSVGFNTSGLMMLALLENKTQANLPYRNANYFALRDQSSHWVNYTEIPQGSTSRVTVGFYLTPQDPWPLSRIRACTDSGWEHGVFIDLGLSE